MTQSQECSSEDATLCADIQALIDDLFLGPGHIRAANRQFRNMIRSKGGDHQDALTDQAFGLINFINARVAEDQLKDPEGTDPPTTEEAAFELKVLLVQFAGFDVGDTTIPEGASDFVVTTCGDPAQPCLSITPSGFSGVFVPAGGCDAPCAIKGFRIDETQFVPTEGPLSPLTDLPQHPIFYNWSLVQLGGASTSSALAPSGRRLGLAQGELNTPGEIAVCVVETGPYAPDNPGALLLAHPDPDNSEGIETLPLSAAPNVPLDCTGAMAGNPPTPPPVGSRGLTLASPGRLGGSISAFSPFAAVDTTSGDGGTPAPSADLAITMTATPDPVAVGADLVHEVTVTNHGPDAVTDVEVSLVVEGNVLIAAAGQEGCTDLFSADPPKKLLTDCPAGDLASGASATLTLTLVPQVAGETLTSTASIDAFVGAADPDLADNSVSETTTVEAAPSADLEITMTATPDPVAVDADLVHEVTVTNHGPDAVTDVEVSLVVEGNVLIAAAGQEGCTDLFSADPPKKLLTDCPAGDLASGASATLTLTLVPQVAGETLTSTASIDAFVGAADPDPADNSDTEETEVQETSGLVGHVLFTSDRDSNDGIFDVYVKDLSTGVVTRLTTGENGISAEWSPDGTKVAYGSEPVVGETYSIRVLTIATSQIQTVATGFRAHDPTWSPDGMKLAYTAYDGEAVSWEIHVVDLSTLSNVVVASSEEVDREPAWSPDGTRIAFQRDYGLGVFEVLAVNLTTGSTSLLYAGFIENMAWAQAGGPIAGSQWKSQDPVYEIVLLDPSTGVVTDITAEGTVSDLPAWSPDRSKIVFARRDPTTGNYDMYVVGATGGSPVMIDSSPGRDLPAGWRLSY